MSGLSPGWVTTGARIRNSSLTASAHLRSGLSPGRGPLQGDCGVVAADLVNICGQALGERWIRDLEHVLRVELAGVGEVEAPDEDEVVGDRHLCVHVVVDRPRTIGCRPLA